MLEILHEGKLDKDVGKVLTFTLTHLFPTIALKLFYRTFSDANVTATLSLEGFCGLTVKPVRRGRAFLSSQSANGWETIL